MAHKKTYHHKNISKVQALRHLAANEDSNTPTENDTPKPKDTLVTVDKNLKPREEENSWDGGIYIPDSEDDFVALGLAESNSSDDKSLVELEGNGLEKNLRLQSGIGSITCSTGWKHTVQDWELQRLKCR